MTSRRPLSPLSGALLGAALLAVTGCSGSFGSGDIRAAEGSVTGLTVSGSPGTAPVVRIAAPLTLRRDSTETVVQGTGPALGFDQLAVLAVTAYDGRTGRKVGSTYDPGQVPALTKSTSLPAELQSLVGVRQGSRVVVARTGSDGVSVLVADVLAVPPAQVLDTATGSTVPPPAGLPRLVLRAGIPDTLDFTGIAKPARTVVATLVEGTGPPVRDRSLVAVRQLGQRWGERLPFDDSFAKEPVLEPVGVRSASENASLVGVRRGSRVLVVGPPDQGTGATICYVIDVLGVS